MSLSLIYIYICMYLYIYSAVNKVLSVEDLTFSKPNRSVGRA